MTTPVSELRFTARYWLETAFPVEDTAAAMAGEQSTGTFLKLASEADRSPVQQQAARIEAVSVLDEVATPSLPGAVAPKGIAPVWRRAEVTLSWPLDSIGPSLPNLLATVAGNLFELRELSGLRLLDITLPQQFLDRLSRPGLRRFRHPSTGRCRAPAADRNHHQAVGRTRCRTHGGSGGKACRCRHRLHQG